MKYKIYFITLVVLIIAGCSSPGKFSGVGRFDFEYDHEPFSIYSTAESRGDQGNMLVKKQDKHIVLRAADYDKDGAIDSVLVGNMTKPDADVIYKQGIQSAQSQNKFKAFKHDRMYVINDPGYMRNYAILTFNTHKMYNKFIVLDLWTQTQTIIIDENADGKLDSSTANSDYQKWYKDQLQRGVATGQIILEDGAYMVVPK